MKIPNWLTRLDKSIPWYWQVFAVIVIWAIALWLINYARNI